MKGEKKAQEYVNKKNIYEYFVRSYVVQAYKDGYEQGQKDTMSYKKENEELKAIISKLKCCGNCKHWRYSCLNEDYICKRTEEIIKSLECYTEKMDKCDKWELAE